MRYCFYLHTMDGGADDRPGYDGEIRLWREDGWWIAKDVETGVTTQGQSREAALANLDDAVALHDGEVGRAPTDEELRELGIDPADNTPTRRSRRTSWRRRWHGGRSPGWR